MELRKSSHFRDAYDVANLLSDTPPKHLLLLLQGRTLAHPVVSNCSQDPLFQGLPAVWFLSCTQKVLDADFLGPPPAFASSC